MSGYNAEHGIPAGDKDEAPTPEPIVLTNMPEPYKEYEFNALLGSYRADELLEEQHMGNLSEYDTAKLVQTVRSLFRKQWADIPANDSRLEHIWEKAGELADSKGYCDVFEYFMNELGTGYAREKEGYATVEVTLTMTVSVPHSLKHGESYSDIELDSYIVNEALECSDMSYAEVTDWNVTDWNED